MMGQFRGDSALDSSARRSDDETDVAGRLVDALTREPWRLGEAVSHVERIETHISWVLLAGAFAYKFKKPVDFGFLDYSTRERRHRFCEEELRLNRRLAPDLYLDVVTFHGDPDAPTRGDVGGHCDVGGPGGAAAAGLRTALESAVRMRRFRQDQLLSHLIREGNLTRDDVERLAVVVAEFHARVAVASPDAPFGTPELVARPVEECFERLLPDEGGEPNGERGTAPLDVATTRLLGTVRDWTRREHSARHDDFARRKSGGFVRECHGDMHLGNVIRRDDGSIAVFDGIEFSEPLRWIDVASEIAFVTMDLADRGRPDFAAVFLNDYLERAADYESLRVLSYYQVYRALVRAKVALLRRGQPGLDAAERQRVDEEIHSYAALAAETARPRHPALLLAHGPSGSGKSTGTRRLIDLCGVLRVRSDVERKRLFGLGPLDSSRSGLASDLYSPDANRKTYDRLRAIARAALESGRVVVLDATFLHRRERDDFRSLAEAAGADCLIVDFQTPDDVLRERVTRRAAAGADPSEATLAVLERQLAHRESLDDEERGRAISADTTQPDWAERLAERLLRRLPHCGARR